MKTLQLLLILVISAALSGLNNVAFAGGTSSPVQSSWSSPKNEVKKKKASHKIQKILLKKTIFKKLLEKGDGSGNNIAGFILGLLGFVFCWVPILGLILCLLGAIFSGLGLGKKNKGLGIAGLVLALLGLIVAIIITIFLFA